MEDLQASIEKLRKYLTSKRFELLKRIVKKRNESVLPVLENLHDRGNGNAVIRTAEAYGFHRVVYLQKPEARFKDSSTRITQGADKWVEQRIYTDLEEMVVHLKHQDYRLYTTHLRADSHSVEELPRDTARVALILGNEKEGISEELLGHCHGNLVLPMMGLTQSFNISVAAAIFFEKLSKQLDPIFLDTEEQKRLLLKYMILSLNLTGEKLEIFLKEQGVSTSHFC